MNTQEIEILAMKAMGHSFMEIYKTLLLNPMVVERHWNTRVPEKELEETVQRLVDVGIKDLRKPARSEGIRG